MASVKFLSNYGPFAEGNERQIQEEGFDWYLVGGIHVPKSVVRYRSIHQEAHDNVLISNLQRQTNGIKDAVQSSRISGGKAVRTVPKHLRVPSGRKQSA